MRRPAETPGIDSSIPPPAERPWRSYKEKLASLSQTIVEAQKPIRILHAIRWPEEAFEKFRAAKYKQLPAYDRDYYVGSDPGFETASKIREFEELADRVANELGKADGLAKILIDTCRQYADVARLIDARGTKEFYTISRRLYGSPDDKFPDGRTRIRDVAVDFYDILTQLDDTALGTRTPEAFPAEDAVAILNDRLNAFFVDDPIRVQLDDGIVADAAAGSDYIKLRKGARFNSRDIDILEAHEGWVHVATSMNGQKQPVARWLAKGPPRTVATQEGLAALTEVLTLRTYPSRARRLNDRVLAVDKAEAGASFLDVFEWFRTEGYEEDVCFWNTARIFRGGVLQGGAPFTKDIVYIQGIVSNYNFLRTAIQAGRPELIPYLFVGKVALEDVPVLWAQAKSGIVVPPTYLPPPFRDLNGLAIWLAISSFWGRLRNSEIQRYYEKLFAAV